MMTSLQTILERHNAHKAHKTQDAARMNPGPSSTPTPQPATSPQPTTLPPASPLARIRGTYDVPADVLADAADKVLETEALQDLCRGCNGHCRQPIPYLRPIVVTSGGRLFPDVLQECRHGRAHREKERIEHLFKTARIPALYARATWDDYETTADNNTAEAAAVIKIFFIIFVVLYLLFKAIAVPLLLDNKKERLLMFSIQSGNR